MKGFRWAAAMLAAIAMGNAANSAVGQERGHLYAHRGGAYEFEENTMLAFRSTYDKGIRGFETDIRMTKDGVLVVLHDDTLDRTHNATGSVEHMTAAELRGVKTKQGQAMLFLDELLEYLADKPGIYLELEMKTSNKDLYPDERLQEYCGKLLKAGLERKPKDSNYVFTSFDERPLKVIHEMDPNAERILITGKACTPEFIQRALDGNFKRIACKMEGTSRAAIKEAQKAGLKINGWPGHTLQDYHLAVGLGVDGICSDIPLEVLAWIKKSEGK